MLPADYALTHEDLRFLKLHDEIPIHVRESREFKAALEFISQWKWPETRDPDAKIIKKDY